MSQSKLRFYLDENMDPEIAEQLRRRGIDALAAREAGMLKASDVEQFQFAAANRRVLCTKDSDFTKPPILNFDHAGIAFFPDSNVGIGYAVNAWQELYQNETAESMNNRFRYL
ncbi:MAG: DUF5615 family PIN-like protein [Chloroflexi bacterium]|nr:DUF5615 family PIN-like protein [Chloroflexota bacterium]